MTNQEANRIQAQLDALRASTKTEQQTINPQEKKIAELYSQVQELTKERDLSRIEVSQQLEEIAELKKRVQEMTTEKEELLQKQITDTDNAVAKKTSI